MLSLISRLIGTRRQAAIPTVDYYFLGAVGDMVRGSERACGPQPIVRLGPHTFAHDRRLVIIRYVTDDEVSIIRRGAWERVFYVIDDVLPVAELCSELPDSYRRKLSQFAARQLPFILALNPVIVAPSEAILDLFPGRPHHRLDPMALSVAGALHHFDQPVSRAHPFRVAFLGTRSHGAGLEFLIPVLQRVFAERDDVRLVHFLGSWSPQQLQRHGQVESRKPLPWPQFRAVLQQQRFHALLAPLPDTPFNRGRSITKFLDAAAVGAAGLFSDRAPFSAVVRHRSNGLLLADNHEEWAGELLNLVRDLSAARKLAAAATSEAQRIGDPARVRGFWTNELGLEQKAFPV